MKPKQQHKGTFSILHINCGLLSNVAVWHWQHEWCNASGIMWWMKKGWDQDTRKFSALCSLHCLDSNGWVAARL